MQNKTLSLTQIALCTASVVLSAMLTLPFGPVPITMQTFAIFLCGGLLGMKRGLMALVLYMILGLVGLPVFSGFRGGFSVLFEPTGGYLLGFFACVVASAVGVKYSEKFAGKSKQNIFLFLSMFTGLVICYFFGTVWYMIFYIGVETISFFSILTVCVFPFVLPDIIKILLAMLLIRKIRPLLNQ